MSSNSGAIIGGVMGGIILLLMIIVVFCIVILCIRRSHRKKLSNMVDNTAKLSTDVVMHGNPSYDVAKVDHIYDTIKPGDSDVTDPSYNVHTKAYSNASEDECNYVKSMQQSDGYILKFILLLIKSMA